MPVRSKWKKTDKPLLWALFTLAVLLAVSVLVWLALVRPQLGKGRSQSISDDYSASTILQDGQTASQTFTFDDDLLAVGVEFYLPGGQPEGELELVLTDADTGEELARSTGAMGYIVPNQYTVLGLDREVQGSSGRRYQLSLTPHYTGTDLLAIGHSSGVALWQDTMQLDGAPVDGTMAVQVTCQRIGGYLTRFFLLICGFGALLAAFTVWAVLSRKVRLPRLVFVLVLGLGVHYSFVLPPYAAPDENTTSTKALPLPAGGPTFSPMTNGGWAMCPPPPVFAGKPTWTPPSRTRTPPCSPGRNSPIPFSPPPTLPTTVTRNTPSCRLTRTPCSIWSAAGRSFWLTFSI